MTYKTLYDDVIEFSVELIELIKEDWYNSKKFIKKHNKYFFWLIVLVITMQFTDIMSLGVSWDKYCKLNGIQNGGESAPPPAAAAPVAAEPVASKPTKIPKKSMFGKAKSGVRSSIKNNPVFGNMGKIFGMVSSMFTLILFILVVVGILSLPVVIFIIITYCIIKNLLSRLAIL